MDEKNNPGQNSSDERGSETHTPDQDSSETDPPDQSADGQTNDSPPPPTSRAWWTRRRRWSALAAAVVATAVIASLTVNAATDNERERLVRDFLEASRDGDVEEALDVVGDAAPSGTEGAFLVPEATDSDWQIVEVEEIRHYEGRNTPSRSTVEVEVSDPNGRPHSTELELAHGDEWQIENSLPEVAFRESGLWYQELNGVTVPVDEEIEEEIKEEIEEVTYDLHFAVLPGFYRAFGHAPEGTETSPGEQFLLPGDTFSSDENTPGLKVTEDGEALIQEEVDALVDDCLDDADMRDLSCPLYISTPFRDRDDEGREIEVDELTWEVAQQPEVAAFATQDSILVSARVRGTAELSAEGTYADGGGSAEVTRTCDIRAQALQAGFDTEGEVQLRARDHRYEPWEEDPQEYHGNLIECP